MRIPKVKPRRFYDVATYGRTYLESDSDYVANNLTACLWFLEHRDALNAIAKGQHAKQPAE